MERWAICPMRSVRNTFFSVPEPAAYSGPAQNGAGSPRRISRQASPSINRTSAASAGRAVTVSGASAKAKASQTDPRPDLGQNRAVAPKILLKDAHASLQHNSQHSRSLPREIPGLPPERPSLRRKPFRTPESSASDIPRKSGDFKINFFSSVCKKLHKFFLFCWNYNISFWFSIVYYAQKDKSGMQKRRFLLMKRKIIKIDEEKCNGCGLCAAAAMRGPSA